jgi:GAF domain-containing protein
LLSVPLLREGHPIGVLNLCRRTVAPFTDKQIELVSTFADQAVIAIENVRLFDEVQARTRDLSESLQQQTATADVLKVISRSTFDLKAVLTTLVQSARDLCNAPQGMVLMRDGEVYRTAMQLGYPPEFEQYILANPVLPNPHSGAGRAAFTGQVAHFPDVLADPEYRLSEGQRLGGYRALLSIPLLREGEVVGVFSLGRTEPDPFSQRQIELVQTFADQAVIAIENVRLFDEVQAKTRDLTEALTYQTGSSNILKVIASSPTDVGPVLQAIADSACELCEANDAIVHLRDGDYLRYRAHHGQIPFGFEKLPDSKGAIPFGVEKLPINRSWVTGRSVVDKAPIHVHDVLSAEGDDFPEAQRLARRQGTRTILSVPLLRENESIGAIVLRRTEVQPFSDKQISLLQTFADQAVIAIGNVRLFDEVQARTAELSESLQFQTATSDVLRVISRSAFNLQTVFDTLTESAAELCEADYGIIFLRRDDVFHAQATFGARPEFLEFLKAHPRRIDDKSIVPRVARTGAVVHIPDRLLDPDFQFAGASEALGHDLRTMLGVPLLRNGAVEGVFVVSRYEPKPFTQRQIELVEGFSDQAVIALENVRLFDEVQAKTRDLSEALTYQTGSGNILKVIASSPTDVGPVLKAIVESACELCDAYDALVRLKHGNDLEFSAHHGPIPVAAGSLPISRNWTGGLAVIERKPVHIHDLLSSEGNPFPEAQQRAREYGHRTILTVPLLREGESVGCIIIRRNEVHPFTDKQIALLQTFADQAVIAIGNVRLFDEVQARTRELTESLQQQTATADVLKVISRSAFDLQPVLDVIVGTSRELCGCDASTIFLLRDRKFHVTAVSGALPTHLEFLRANPSSVDQPGSILARVYREKRTLHYPNIADDPELSQGMTGLGGPRALLTVPLMRDDEVIGAITLRQSHLKPFTDRQIEAIETFADQAVIAISNVGLFEQVQQRTQELSQSLDDLRTAQDRLVQTEKLASLGQLTAGIAHEIKNPLNFVNNFSALSAELTDELNDLLKSAVLTDKLREEVDELTGMLKDNLQKVVQHGKRADSIVKNMLLHSREGAGEHRPADINALLDESLNLAYHGARAEKPQFNVTLQRDFDAKAGMIEVFPQEITRVFLNLISNGFYAVTKRRAENGNSGFEPLLVASTRDLGESVEIRIRDNGTGIPEEVREKMFNPFFTTKPAGEGTGLGLSMSHDIIVKQHGGRIDVATEPGQFTEFTIVLPRKSNQTNNQSDKIGGPT